MQKNINKKVEVGTTQTDRERGRERERGLGRIVT